METRHFKKLPLGGLDRRALVGALAAGRAARGDRAARRAARRGAPGRHEGRARRGRAHPRRLERDHARPGGAAAVRRARQRLRRPLRQREDADRRPSTCRRSPRRPRPRASPRASGTRTRPSRRRSSRSSPSSSGKYRAVHLINGIAAGATKRYVEHGPTQVKDLDVAFNPVLQVPDFSKPENVRKVGLVDVEVATDVDIERTNKLHGQLVAALGRAARRRRAAGEGRERGRASATTTTRPTTRSTRWARSPARRSSSAQTMGADPRALRRADRAALLPAGRRRRRSAPSPAASSCTASPRRS